MYYVSPASGLAEKSIERTEEHTTKFYGALPKYELCAHLSEFAPDVSILNKGGVCYGLNCCCLLLKKKPISISSSVGSHVPTVMFDGNLYSRFKITNNFAIPPSSLKVFYNAYTQHERQHPQMMYIHAFNKIKRFLHVIP